MWHSNADVSLSFKIFSTDLLGLQSFDFLDLVVIELYSWTFHADFFWVTWAVPTVNLSFQQEVTHLRREDIVGWIPDSLHPTHVGVAHTFHFGEDRADGRVCGLVAFLVDENPPVWRHRELLACHADQTISGHSPAWPDLSGQGHTMHTRFLVCQIKIYQALIKAAKAVRTSL